MQNGGWGGGGNSVSWGVGMANIVYHGRLKKIVDKPF